MNTFNIILTVEQLEIIGNLLGNAPFRVVAPIVQSINRQIAEQKQIDEPKVPNDPVTSA